jgi:tyrosine-protein kinase Etk/Wzc
MTIIRPFQSVLFLIRHLRLIAVCTLLGLLGAVCVSLSIRPSYSSDARVMPPNQAPPGLISLVSQLSLANGGQIPVVKNPNDLYIGILRSRSIADAVIRLTGFKQALHMALDTDARTALAGMSQISSGKDGLITIRVTAHDAPLAARIANQYVQELIRLTRTIAMTDATARRQFFELQLQHAQEQLNVAEQHFRSMQEDAGLLSPEHKMGIIIGQLTQLKTVLAEKKLQLATLRSHLTEDSPEVLRLQKQISDIKQQLSTLEHGMSGEGYLAITTKKIPQGSQEYLRRFRHVKYNETMFELISKQYELAKIAEASNHAIVQILDTAVAAEKKSGPFRSRIAVFGLMVGLGAGLLAAGLKESMQRLAARGEAGYWQQIKIAWHNAV